MMSLPRCEKVVNDKRCRKGATHMEVTGLHCDEHAVED